MRRASGWWSCSAPPSGGPSPPAASCGAGWTCSWGRSRARPWCRFPSPATTTWSLRRRGTCTRCPKGSPHWRCISMAPSTTGTRAAACGSCWSPGRSRSTTACRCRSGVRRSSTTTPTARGSRYRATPTRRSRAPSASGGWRRWMRRSPSCCARPSTEMPDEPERRETPDELERGETPDELEQLVQALLWEGYALYPYTPQAIKNATPTPFGIVYPPAYAASCPGAFDHARLECVALPEPGALLSASVHYLAAVGGRHRAVERRLELGPVQPGEEAAEAFDGGRAALRSQWGAGGELLVRCCVHNTAAGGAELDRAGALARSLLSTQIVVRISRGRFRSPLEGGCRSVNTYPVLVGERDDAVLGTGIALPDHPQIAPESRGDLFDCTEIEEALLLHVQALSDAERAHIESQDPRLRDTVARAASATPEEIMALHGRVTLRDPLTTEPPRPPADLPDPTRGEREAVAGGVRFRRGGRLVLRPGPRADAHARMLEGCSATIERILIDHDGRVHLGVTIDSDPGRDLMRDTGRLLYFFPEEVQPL